MIVKRQYNTEDLIHQYIETAIRYGEGIVNHEPMAVNKECALLHKIVKKIKKNENNQLIVLLPLLNHPDDYVRLTTASYTYEIANNEARHTLQELTKKKYSFAGLDAKMILDIIDKQNKTNPGFLQSIRRYFR